MAELAYNLESFNPAFTAVLLKVQSTIGRSDYVRRDLALKNLIQPLAGEYGMHNDEPQGERGGAERRGGGATCAPRPRALLLRGGTDGRGACTRAAHTHRELFSMFYADLMKEPLERLLAEWGTPAAAELLYGQMMRDIMSTEHGDAVAQVRWAGGGGAPTVDFAG